MYIDLGCTHTNAIRVLTLFVLYSCTVCLHFSPTTKGGKDGKCLKRDEKKVRIKIVGNT